MSWRTLPWMEEGSKEARGHVWVKQMDYETGKETDEVDCFAFAAGEYHNGPRCKVCGYGFCEHCEDGPGCDCPGEDGKKPEDDYDDSNLDRGLVAFDQALRRR